MNKSLLSIFVVCFVFMFSVEALALRVLACIPDPPPPRQRAHSDHNNTRASCPAACYSAALGAKVSFDYKSSIIPGRHSTCVRNVGAVTIPGTVDRGTGI